MGIKFKLYILDDGKNRRDRYRRVDVFSEEDYENYCDSLNLNNSLDSGVLQLAVI